MRALFAVLAAAMMFAVKARDITLAIDTTGSRREAFPHGAPCVGYSADPKAGGDEAFVLACRHAGGWLFHTTVCDDATLAFCAEYELRLFVVLSGSPKEVNKTFARLAKSPHRKVIAGFQLGADAKGGPDPTLWRRIAAQAAKEFPGVKIALPVEGLDSPIFGQMKDHLAHVTHLVVDARKESAPYARLKGIAEQLRCSSDKSVSKLRLLAAGPGNLPGRTDGQASAPATVAWQMHWIMSALAVRRTDGVFVGRPYRPDGVGRAMRHLWVVTNLNRTLVAHGEGASSGKAADVRSSATAAKASVGLDDEEDLIELQDAEQSGPVPNACSNVAAGKPGDVEYLALMAPPTKDDGQHGCLVLVNTTGERAKLSLNVNGQGGSAGPWRHGLVPDESREIKMRDFTRTCGGKPFAETLEPGEVAFIDFRF